jgi:DNA repair protein RadC
MSDVIPLRDSAAEREDAARILAPILGARAARRAAPLGLATLARLDAISISHETGASPRASQALVDTIRIGRAILGAELAASGLSARGPSAVFAIMSPRIAHLEHEELWLLALDGQNDIRGLRKLAMGGSSGLAVQAADVLRAALETGARGFVLAHNHPSGDPTPSSADLALTSIVAAGARAIGVPLLDHVVVSRRGYAQVPI